MASRYYPSTGGIRRKSSGDSLMDTAEDLVDNLDSLADILVEIEDKYTQKSVGNVDEELSNGDTPFIRLKDGLECARTLIGCLKREKSRLNKRQMSVELRMGELEDYKSHLKQDMTSMNDSVEVLSRRIIQLENELCEGQERIEDLESEKGALVVQLQTSDEKRNKLESHKQELMEELKTLQIETKYSKMKEQKSVLQSEVDVLLEENKKLKEMIRDADENSSPEAEVDGEDKDGSDSPRIITTSTDLNTCIITA